MVIIDTHFVIELQGDIRFVDYAIGIFPQLQTKNSIKKSIKRKELFLNDNLAVQGAWMKENDKVVLVDPGHRLPKPYACDIAVIYEDDYLVIVNKPPGLTVSGNRYETLENALVDKVKLSTQPDAWKWVKPVHRLDSATSGLVLFSKTANVHIQLAKLFEGKQIKKTYIALLTGHQSEDIIIDSPINNQEAISELKVIEVIESLRNEFLTLVKFMPKTGRTHQLRIHSKSIGHPIVGDKAYGEEGNTLLKKGMFLSAIELEFVHPITYKEIRVSLDMPYKFKTLLDRETRRWNKYN
ncbi:MAG: RluA family pseudouridine synthase [Crocinitomicaceae bacterium]